ncbi:aldolase catalytic domain-containing protein [Mucilaginibacter auburnensis]|uniref:4-hydroxy 2-oxovalerate aldolase n=1 Tax=Mucilaginibacter auburnensis TaxID=1457233 RepID=A0A2H9VTA2_9SPHI|nr:aldolase catalytic domain-containing protein [Mucilaginibacter auburnensis]PJJ84055.1 4-hydroxy 2-oxovalerate aldolase [Mucilaginibacter auburnensis]
MYKILDCTLRDGGYYNGWDFDDKLVETYLKAMEALPVSYIEVGYRNNGRYGYEGKYFYCPKFILEKIRSLVPSKKIAVMFNEKDVKPEEVARLLEPCKGLVDIVRMAVAPTRIPNAIELSKAIKAEGFEAAVNMMYMSSLLDDKADAIFEQLPAMEGIVDYFSLVDSYGGVYPADVSRLVKKCKALLSMPIGFHGHNNIELVFANSLAAIEAGCDMVDATVTGMGRGAGNLKTELILTHQATKDKVDVDFNSLANVVTDFEELQAQYGWGTNLPYMVSGANSLPQKDVMDWVSKRSYSINSIIRGLSNQSKGQKDNLELPKFDGSKFKYKNAVIIGGGAGAIEHSEGLIRFIRQQEDICVIHASSKNSWAYADITHPQFFCLVGNEGHRLEKTFKDLDKVSAVCVLPPFPRKMGTYIPDAVIEHSFELPTVSFTNRNQDSHTALALQAVIDMGVENIYIAGYDGYAKVSITSNEQALFNENEYSFAKFAESGKKVYSLTPTLYSLDQVSIYSLIEE